MREVKIPQIRLPSSAPSQLNTKCYLGIESPLPHSSDPQRQKLMRFQCTSLLFVATESESPPHFLAIAVLGEAYYKLRKSFS